MPSNIKRDLVQSRERLLLSDLNENKVVQRRFDQAHAEAILEDYHPVGVNDLVVVKINNGSKKHYIVDGQHTKWVLEKLGIKYAWCRVILAQTHKEMNEIFQLINRGSKSLSPLESFILNAEHDPSSVDYAAQWILLDQEISVNYPDAGGVVIESAPEVRQTYKTLGPEGFKEAVVLMRLVADGGSKLDVSTLRAIRAIVKKHYGDSGAMRDLAIAIGAEYPSLKGNAIEKCLGAHLSSKIKVLVDEIESAAFVPRVNFSTVKFPAPKKRVVS